MDAQFLSTKIQFFSPLRLLSTILEGNQVSCTCGPNSSIYLVKHFNKQWSQYSAGLVISHCKGCWRQSLPMFYADQTMTCGNMSSTKKGRLEFQIAGFPKEPHPASINENTIGLFIWSMLGWRAPAAERMTTGRGCLSGKLVTILLSGLDII